MPLISIVTPVHNRPAYLEEAIKSAYAQTFTDWEHIIVDDGSTNPETQTILKGLSSYSKTTIYRKENGGLGSARNYAIERATGKYILTLDDDDKWHPDFAARAVEILEKSPQTGVVTSWMQYFDHGKGIVKPLGGDVTNFLISNNCVHAMFRKECWSKAGKYDENKFFQAYTDWDLWLRVTDAGNFIHVIQEPLFYYRIHKEPSMLQDAGKVHLDLFKHMIEKNKDIYSRNMTETLLRFEKKVMELRSSTTAGNPAVRVKRMIKSLLSGRGVW